MAEGHLKIRRENVMGKVRRVSSRNQEGGGYQLNSTSNVDPTFLHRKGGLCPCRVIRAKGNVSDWAHDLLSGTDATCMQQHAALMNWSAQMT